MIKYAECVIEVKPECTVQPTRVRQGKVDIVAQGMAGIEAAGKEIVITGKTMEEVMAQVKKLIAEGKLVRKE